MLNKKSVILRILLFTASILILIIPDILINDNKHVLNFCLSVASKICLFLFFGLLLLRLTRSYFRAYLILGIPYLISSIIESFNIIILRNYITADNIVSLLNASVSEIREFYSGFKIYFILPLILIIAFCLILRAFRSIPYEAKYKRRLIPLAFAAIMISLSISVVTLYRTGNIYSGKNLKENLFGNFYLHQHPFNLLNESYIFAKIKISTYKYRAQHDNFKFEVLNPTDTVRPKLVIFIIGERMRAANWSLNGYKRETTPNLQKVPDLISFSKNYSNSNFTYGSIPLIITQATPKSPVLAHSQKSVVSLFKEAGFETTWISSQYLFDIVDERKVPDHVYELYKKPHTDMDVLPVFDSVINKKTTKDQFIVINLLGGHGGVPAQFNVFKPNDSQKDYPITMQNAPIFINSYDNMILLQDYVLAEIMNRVLKQNVSSVVMFTADHGCNLFDNGKALFGYGSAHPTENEAHVPMLVSLSGKFIERNPGKYKNLISHKNLITTNNDLFYTVADLAGIRYKYYDKRLSISDSAYVEPPSRFLYINGKVIEYKNK